MRRRIGFSTVAALSISGIGCGVAGVATDVLLADVLADAVIDTVSEVLESEFIAPAGVSEPATPGHDPAAEVRGIVEQLVDAVVEEVVVAREVPRDSVIVTLVNNSPSFLVEVTVAYDDHILPLVWLGLGSEKTFVLQPGETVSFWKDCDDLRTVMIKDADLLIPGRRNRETESAMLNEGIDYECDDEIRFVFDHTDELRDFDVSVGIRSPNRAPRPSLQDSIVQIFDD